MSAIYCLPIPSTSYSIHTLGVKKVEGFQKPDKMSGFTVGDLADVKQM